MCMCIYICIYVHMHMVCQSLIWNPIKPKSFGPRPPGQDSMGRAASQPRPSRPSLPRPVGLEF